MDINVSKKEFYDYALTCNVAEAIKKSGWTDEELKAIGRQRAGKHIDKVVFKTLNNTFTAEQVTALHRLSLNPYDLVVRCENVE